MFREKLYQRMLVSTKLIKARRFMWTAEIVERVLADAAFLEFCGFPRLARHVRAAARSHPRPRAPQRTSVSSTARNDVA
jgi:hypothetical protein